MGKQHKRLQKAEAKKVEENKKASETAIAAAVASTRAALADGTIPKDPATREAYFMEQISIGELLFNRGEDFHLDSATAFFRALKVYPQPFELLIILGKTVPPEVNAIIMKMVEKDVVLAENDGPSNPLAAAAASASIGEVDDDSPSGSDPQEAKETPKEDSKEESKEEAKEEAKGDSKEEPKEEAKEDSKDESKESTQSKSEEEKKDYAKPESVSSSTNEWDVVSATSEKQSDEATIGKGFGAAAQPAATTAPIHFSFGSMEPSPAADQESQATGGEAQKTEVPEPQQEAAKPAEEPSPVEPAPTTEAPKAEEEAEAAEPKSETTDTSGEQAPKEAVSEEPVANAPQETSSEKPASEAPKEGADQE